ncbi:MAG: malectin domain-containing carbohydrate-binding protein, partial [Bacteroidota bacterium]
MSEGDIINLQELNGDALNVNANTDPATVGSVKFILQGASFRTENAAPYALAGNSGANYADWRPTPGDYVIEAIPFTQARGQGTAGTSLTINFTVVNQEPVTTVPTAPSALAASVTQPGAAVLSWEDNSTDEASFLIEYTDEFNGSSGWEVLTSVPANSTSYTDNTLEQQDYRYYRITAVNGAGSSDLSETIEVANLPYPPTEIIVSNVTSTSFDLQWTEPPFGNDYQIDVASSEDVDYEYYDAFYFGYTDFSYLGFDPATTYYFRMRTNFDSQPSDWTYFTVTTINDAQNSLPAVVRINAGGSETSYGDSVFIADTYFSGDGKSYSNSSVTSIDNTTQDELYLTERSTNQNLQSFSYDIPITNGNYEIKLHFAEIYFGATGGGSGGSNKRVFSVAAEESPILTNYDINAQVGPMTAVIETFTVQVTDGTLNLDFSASVNQPKVSAIEIYGEGSLLEEPVTCGWNDLAGSSLSKVEAQSAKVNGKLYILAGFLAGLKITGATEIYDPATDSWSLGAPMPTPVTHMGAAVIGD